VWPTTLRRFESNGWPGERLHTVEIRYPNARDDANQAQPARSSTQRHRQALARTVERVRHLSGEPRVVRIANSRGGPAVRHFIAQGGAASVSHEILCGTPNHGVFADPAHAPGSEFNVAGAFLLSLDDAQGPGGGARSRLACAGSRCARTATTGALSPMANGSGSRVEPPT